MRDAGGDGARDGDAGRRALGADGADEGFDEDGFVFFSNYESRKGRELAANPRAALLFYWDPLGRQVRIEGPVERVSAAESAEYIRSRPRGAS